MRNPLVVARNNTRTWVLVVGEHWRGKDELDPNPKKKKTFTHLSWFCITSNLFGPALGYRSISSSLSGGSMISHGWGEGGWMAKWRAEFRRIGFGGVDSSTTLQPSPTTV